MFAGSNRNRKPSSVRAMQLFHELKQQFPAAPDHVVSACVATHGAGGPASAVARLAERMGRTARADAAASSRGSEFADDVEMNSKNIDGVNKENAGNYCKAKDSVRFPSDSQPDSDHCKASSATDASSQDGNEMNSKQIAQSDANASNRKAEDSVMFPSNSKSATDASSQPCKFADDNKSDLKTTDSKHPDRPKVSSATETSSQAVRKTPRRPDRLDIRPSADPAGFGSPKFDIRPSEKCKDIHKLLSREPVDRKPPRSPLGSKKPAPAPPKKRETCSTPSQTTDTLLGVAAPLDVSVSVNCSVARRTSVLEVTPSQPWLVAASGSGSGSPRSYTSVNLTLRPPGATPQDPIDVTSKNSSLTYSTSSFDSSRGLQSRLEITVGPGGGSVSSVRTRPRSCHLAEGVGAGAGAGGGLQRSGSLGDVALDGGGNEPPVILRQQARIERLRIELNTEKAKLVITQREVAELEKNRLENERRADAEFEKQLLMEINHLRSQCEQLTLADKEEEEFYSTIYTGPRGLTAADLPGRLRQPNRRRLRYQGPAALPHPLADVADGPKWNCSQCTFLNHPDLDRCEQCEMPRILHGTERGALDSNLCFDTLKALNGLGSRSFSDYSAAVGIGMDSDGESGNGVRLGSRSAPDVLAVFRGDDVVFNGGGFDDRLQDRR